MWNVINPNPNQIAHSQKAIALTLTLSKIKIRYEKHVECNAGGVTRANISLIISKAF